MQLFFIQLIYSYLASSIPIEYECLNRFIRPTERDSSDVMAKVVDRGLEMISLTITFTFRLIWKIWTFLFLPALD